MNERPRGKHAAGKGSDELRLAKRGGGTARRHAMAEAEPPFRTRAQWDRVSAFGVALVLLCGNPTGSWAAVASCDDDAACRPVVSRAREFSKAGQLDDALLSYQAAYRITPDPRILFNIARIQQKQNKLAEALESYQKFVDTKFDDENLRSKAQEYMTQIQAAQAEQQAKAAEPPPAGVGALTAGGATGQERASESKPVYKKAWFWLLIGGVAAAGIAGGVAGGVIASQSPPSAPSAVPTFHLFK